MESMEIVMENDDAEDPLSSVSDNLDSLLS